ncbi:formate dehydrogenase accessory sulfurtransferase FdhD [Sphingomonas sp. AX6]|uniref:formate dehydrogenase accessory sulfurtransferase FdhD n=1 Tax=Sphingomonas sp. AX6 TaxID=2653171 RepID=UPI00135CA2E3|nr:formate dehydrogenase accessory sulfurtransferase FdhD [Sphingomonas sp. AX6]
MDSPAPSIAIAFRSISPDGSARVVERGVAVERPLAIEFNGIGYAVMMATPADLQDFATGFALSERLIEATGDLVDFESIATPHGDLLRVTLSAPCVPLMHQRVRHRVSESSCGMCGIENLDQALRPLPQVPRAGALEPDAVFRALGALRDHQPLNRATGAVHAAALCDVDGGIRLVREDVGRHNAFDKLIGAMARAGLGWDGGFALLSSRCSYELVEKAALAGCSRLVTISAPTDLALARAADAGIDLIVLARSDAVLAAITE